MKKFFLSLVCMAFAGVVLAQNAQLPQNVTLKTLDGQSVQTSTIQNDGKPIIISFWATWCKPCHVELNTINEVYEEWQNETGVKLVAVSIDDARSANKVKPDVAGMGWEYEIYLDQNQDFKRAMNVVNPPHTFVINGKGEIVYQHAAFVPGDEDELYEAVKKAAAEE